MTLGKKITWGILAVFVIIQFIRPTKNVSEKLITDNDISKTYAVSDEVHQLLIKKCYDCHSNSTVYPWYNNIQPVGWWMALHVDEGKDELNFSEFKTYPEKKANHKMEELSEAINEGWMPIDSYLWIHGDAKITEDDKELINTWIKTLPIVFEED